MAGLKTIKTKIVAMKKSQTVTKAMEAVSAAKMRKSQQTALGGRAYARAAASVLARVSGSREMQNHPLTRSSGEAPQKVLYIVITSDKGLAGALNSAVLRKVQSDIAEGQNKSSNFEARIIAVGRKANDFFAARGFAVETFHPNTNQISSSTIEEIVHEAARRFTEGEVDAVKIAYQNFISTFEQNPTLHTIFPLSLEDLERVVEGILPTKGAFSMQHTPAVSASSRTTSYTIEPSESQVLENTLPLLASIMVYHALLESQASEHSARMVAMKSASDKAEERQGELTLEFNKARQASITREVSEITGGMEAMAA